MKHLRTVGLTLSFLVFALGHTAVGGSFSAGLFASLFLKEHPHPSRWAMMGGGILLFSNGLLATLNGRPFLTAVAKTLSSNWLSDLGLFLLVAGSSALSLHASRLRSLEGT